MTFAKKEKNNNSTPIFQDSVFKVQMDIKNPEICILLANVSSWRYDVELKAWQANIQGVNQYLYIFQFTTVMIINVSHLYI